MKAANRIVLCYNTQYCSYTSEILYSILEGGKAGLRVCDSRVCWCTKLNSFTELFTKGAQLGYARFMV